MIKRALQHVLGKFEVPFELRWCSPPEIGVLLGKSAIPYGNPYCGAPRVKGQVTKNQSFKVTSITFNFRAYYPYHILSSSHETQLEWFLYELGRWMCYLRCGETLIEDILNPVLASQQQWLTFTHSDWSTPSPPILPSPSPPPHSYHQT